VICTTDLAKDQDNRLLLVKGGGQSMLSSRVSNYNRHSSRERMHVLAIMSEAAITWTMPLLKHHPAISELIHNSATLSIPRLAANAEFVPGGLGVLWIYVSALE
jgi:hypothetical protein